MADKKITVELEEKDLRADLVNILVSMTAIRKEELKNKKIDNPTKNE